MFVRILLIEDDERLAERTAEYLRDHDAEVEIALDGERGLRRALEGDHDLALLDVMLPGMDGLAVCKQLRAQSNLPVIMLTARGDEVDRVVGLELGADDYVPKPFSPRELLARIRAVLRRHQTQAQTTDAEQSVQLGGLKVDRDRRQVSFEDHGVELTAYQFDVLWVLAKAAGRVLPRGALHNEVRELRGEEPIDFDPSVDRSIDVHLSKIRGALDAASPGAGQLIRTVRGVGYVLGEDGP